MVLAMRAHHGIWAVLSTSLALSGCPAGDGTTTGDGAAPTDIGGRSDAPIDNGNAAPDARSDAGADVAVPLDAAPTSDASPTQDAPASDAVTVADGPDAGCEARETCADGVDNNCNGRVDEDCPCTPGMEQRCFPSRYEERGGCRAGRQLCTGTGEFGRWSQCQGAVEPSNEQCDNVDNDCDGAVDEDLSRACYSGPTGTSGVGLCRGGTQQCAAGAWGVCSGSVTPVDETCNGMDDDCDGTPDDSVSRSCYPGPEGTEGRGLCRAGGQTCTAGAFGTCTGAVTPTEETCNGQDDDCDGMVDEDLTRSCYPGAAGTSGVGVCRGGISRCAMGTFGACDGAVVPGIESCGNGTDDNCDGMIDENCHPCIMGTASGSPWQINRTMGPVCFGRTFSTHGERGEYDLATIPPETAGGWTPVTATTIDFAEASALCGRECTCLNGGEFTYFQTFFDISAGYRVTSLSVTMGGVDDGARITVFNSTYPSGVVDDGSYVLLGGTSTSTDLARFITVGRNRIVITHIDDCCSARSLSGVAVVLNGGSLETCH